MELYSEINNFSFLPNFSSFSPSQLGIRVVSCFFSGLVACLHCTHDGWCHPYKCWRRRKPMYMWMCIWWTRCGKRRAEVFLFGVIWVTPSENGGDLVIGECKRGCVVHCIFWRINHGRLSHLVPWRLLVWVCVCALCVHVSEDTYLLWTFFCILWPQFPISNS